MSHDEVVSFVASEFWRESQAKTSTKTEFLEKIRWHLYVCTPAIPPPPMNAVTAMLNSANKLRWLLSFEIVYRGSYDFCVNTSNSLSPVHLALWSSVDSLCSSSFTGITVTWSETSCCRNSCCTVACILYRSYLLQGCILVISHPVISFIKWSQNGIDRR